jgi:outer membrane autotransporter protein
MRRTTPAALAGRDVTRNFPLWMLWPVGGVVPTALSLAIVGLLPSTASADLTIGGPTDGTFSGSIGGTGSVVKVGTGTETMTGTNTYTGGTIIEDGTLAVGAGGSLSAVGSVTLAASGSAFDISSAGNQTIGPLSGVPGSTVTLGGNTLTINAGADGSFDGRISGTGGLVKNGAGIQELGGSNTFLGGVALNAGGLVVGNDGALGNGALRVNGDSTLAAGVAALNIANDVALSSGAVLELVSSSNATVSGNITGTGSLAKDGAGKITLTGLGGYQGDTTISNGTLALSGVGALGTGALTVKSGATLDFSNIGYAALSIGPLSGGGNVVAGGHGLTVNQSGDSVFDGIITGVGTGLTKNDAGTLVLNGANTYTGPTAVTGGTLLVGDPAHTAAAIAGNVEVGSSGTLGGSGTVGGNVDAVASSRLAPGGIGTLGTLTVNGDLTLESGANLEFDFGAPGLNFTTPGQSDHIVVNGNLSIGASTLNVNDFGSMGPGLYNLFEWGGTLSYANGGFAPSVGSSVQILTIDKQINLIDTQNVTLQYWNANGFAGSGALGGGSGTWSVTNFSWTNSTGSLTGPMSPVPGFAIFGGAPGTVTVDNTNGSVSATGMQFMSDGYHLTGDPIALVAQNGMVPVLRVGAGATATIDNVINSNDGLNKTDAGTLVLNGANIYAGNTVISGGTLSIHSDSNIGLPANPLDFEGGTLQVTGNAYHSTSRNIIWGNPGGGFDIADASNVFTVTQSLGGAGGLLKAGAGRLVLTGANTYTGGTLISGGTLQGNTTSLTGHITNNANLIFDEAVTGTYAGVVSGSGSLTKQGAGALTLTGANTYSGGTTIAAGTVQGNTTSLQGDIVNDAALVFDQASDGTYAGTLTGNGTLTKQGAGTLLVSGSSGAYAGATNLAMGGLEVGGNLGGRLALASGTTLTGAGTVGSTTVGSGATVSPGTTATPIATMNVAGNITFAPGSTYRVNTTIAGAHDSIHATGTASLAGSVVSLGENGNYAASTSYRILTADNGVSGTFNNVASNLAFLTPSLVYDAHNVDLLVQLKQTGGGGDNGGGGGTLPIQFADLAQSLNQRATANGLQSLPTSNALYQRVLNLPNGAPPAVFNSLSGEMHASTTSILQAIADNTASMTLSHLHDNLKAGQMPGAPTAQLGSGDASSLPRPAASPLWAQVFGNWHTIDSTNGGDTAKVKDTDAGLLVGGDGALGDGWRLGGALGYTNSDIDLHARSSSNQVDSYTAALYGGKAFDAGPGKINFSLGAAYTWHDLDIKRDTNAAGVAQTLDSSYGASTAQVFTEFGFALPLNDTTTLEPFTGADYSDLRTRAFSESGGDAALDGKSNRNQIAATTLGLHAQTKFESARTQGSLTGTLGWRHAFGDVDPTTTMAFDGSQPFTIAGAPIARDAAVLQLGVNMDVSRSTTVSVSYSGQFGDGNQQNAGMVDVRYRF